MMQFMPEEQYNVIAGELEHKLDFLLDIDEQIKQAEKAGFGACALVLWRIKLDEERHAKMLRSLLTQQG